MFIKQLQRMSGPCKSKNTGIVRIQGQPAHMIYLDDHWSSCGMGRRDVVGIGLHRMRGHCGRLQGATRVERGAYIRKVGSISPLDHL